MRSLKAGIAGFCWLLLVAALSLPVLLSLEHLQQPPSALAVMTGAIGLVLLAVGLRASFRSPLFWWLLVLLILLLVFLRASWFGIVQFSGAGFTQDFFIHLDWHSVEIAWQEHGRLVRRGLGLMLLVLAGLVMAGRFFVAPPARSALLLLPMGLILVFSARQAMPEHELLTNWIEWRKPITAHVDESQLARFRPLGLLDEDVLPVPRIQAELPAQPKNLVLVYLESVGVNLAHQPQWPELMPNFGRLLDEHGWVDHLWTSSYITVEGLTNSMCGTLFPFRRDSDSLAEGEGLGDNLPCLGDVLQRAGYHQVYLGGAGMGFAGKGDFLGAHGYDELKGLEYWQSIGLEQRPGTWGLSDVELFDQSIAEMQRLRQQDQPWNLTLLTIGTHIPGYLYEECQAYPHGSDQFLDSLHCSDQLLGNWLDRMQAEGLMEDTIVVITADHHVFPNPEMRALFGDDVLDRRLPLIVLGDDVRPARHPHGAGYDLAPTVLDLLDVQHNARFILGRSLAQDHDRPDYYVKRYADVHEGQVVAGPALDCRERKGGRVTLPLDSCAREDFLGLTEALVLSVSRSASQLNCSSPDANFLRLPDSLDEPLEVVVGGSDQAGRFTYQSRTVSTTLPGLYHVEFDDSGVVLSRRFYPVAELSERELLLLETQDAFAHVLAWRPRTESDERAELPSAGDLPALPASARLWFADNTGQWQVQDGVEDADSRRFDLASVFCDSNSPAGP